LEPVIEIEQQPQNKPACSTCGVELGTGSRFCSNCGAIQKEIREEIPEHIFELNARYLVVFYLVQLLTCLAVSAFDIFNDYRNLVWVEVFLAVFTLVFAGVNFRNILPLYSFRNLKVPLLLLCAACAIVASAIVHYAVSWVNLTVFHKTLSYYPLYEPLQHGELVLFLSVAVYPALFEELEFRGIVYNYTEQAAGPTTAIWISSMAFAIIHVNVLSLLWIVPFALVVGWLRNKYQTLWYDMIIHLCFNGTICVFELFDAGYFHF
jgi:membrane protease YdiL (CAAX protease family)